MSFTYQSSNLSQAIKSNFAETENRFNTLSYNISMYNSTNRPAANSVSAGTQIWVTDKKTLMISDGSSWINVGQPVGSIAAFSSNTIPDGWVMADGSTGKSVVTTTALTDLFNYWGGAIYGGTGNTSFTLPDYRSQFLRGWANGSVNDPDRASRTNRGDGTTGDAVGTKQADQFKSHLHTTHVDTSNGWAVSNPTALTKGATGFQGGTGSDRGGTSYSGFMDNTGGNQTNPININVMYCIKL